MMQTEFSKRALTIKVSRRDIFSPEDPIWIIHLIPSHTPTSPLQTPVLRAFFVALWLYLLNAFSLLILFPRSTHKHPRNTAKHPQPSPKNLQTQFLKRLKFLNSDLFFRLKIWNPISFEISFLSPSTLVLKETKTMLNWFNNVIACHCIYLAVHLKIGPHVLGVLGAS